METITLGAENRVVHKMFCITQTLRHCPCVLLPKASKLHEYYSRQMVLFLGALLKRMSKMLSVSADASVYLVYIHNGNTAYLVVFFLPYPMTRLYSARRAITPVRVFAAVAHDLTYQGCGHTHF